jgi:2-polyprenyl-6-methoxyphenol hydroxylase-like FAD-dependent oxidoreductase
VQARNRAQFTLDTTSDDVRLRVMDADVIIIGGGPAGMMAGLLFARAGIETLVLEKHGDFLRDFRGDTVHPSTMEILHELGMLERFLARPHDRIDQAIVRVAGQTMKLGDLRFLKTPAPFIAMMPQWDFLDFLQTEAAQFPAFRLRMNADVVGVIEDKGKIGGVRLVDGESILAGKLVIFADGRSSLVRQHHLLPVTELGAPMDVLWFRLPRNADDPEGLRGIFEAGRVMVLIGRGDYWQCAFVIPKGAGDALKQRGIAPFRAEIEAALPEMGSLAAVLTNVDQLKLLTVVRDRLDRWFMPGLLVIGDAAHAMSPLGGIGINLAIQDAVAAANILASPILSGEDLSALLPKVQARRSIPTRIIQAGQGLAQNNFISPLIRPDATLDKPPAILGLLNRFPLLRRIPGRIIGLGVRREHVRSPNVG